MSDILSDWCFIGVALMKKQHETLMIVTVEHRLKHQFFNFREASKSHNMKFSLMIRKIRKRFAREFEK